MLSSGVVSELAALSANASWISERTAQLNVNKTGLAELNAMTERLLAAINVLVASTSTSGVCSGPDSSSSNCTAYWSSFYPAVLSGYNFTDASSLSTAQLRYVFAKATVALLGAAPYSEQMNTSDMGASEAPLYGKGTGSRYVRGGVNSEYTRRVFFNTRQDFVDSLDPHITQPPTSSPFKQILAVGNGECVHAYRSSRVAPLLDNCYPTVGEHCWTAVGERCWTAVGSIISLV